MRAAPRLDLMIAVVKKVVGEVEVSCCAASTCVIAVASASAWFSGKTTIEWKLLAELSSFKELLAAFDV